MVCGVVLACGCRPTGPGYGLGAAETSSEGSAGPAGGASAGEGGGTEPDSQPLVPPFELPPGCGDGVVVAGQYDCHYPIPLNFVAGVIAEREGVDPDPWRAKLLSRHVAWDMDGDGRDELVLEVTIPLSATGPGVVRLDVVLTLGDDGFEVGNATASDVTALQWTTRYDTNADGIADLIKVQNSGVGVHLGTGTTTLSPEQFRFYEVLIDYRGFMAPLDVDGDGRIELLGIRWPYTALDPYPPRETWLHRETALWWEPVGESFAPVGCQVAGAYAYADFDGDGVEDVAMFDHPTGCDPHLLTYDPEYHAVTVFLVDQVAGALRAPSYVPIGAFSHDKLFVAEDFDGDGNADLLVALGSGQDSAMHGASVMWGRGDGTFADGVAVEIPGLDTWEVEARADLDGDGDLDWLLAEGGLVLDDPFAADPGIVAVVSDVVGYDGNPFSSILSVGDFNGDGIDDFVGSHRNRPGEPPAPYSRVAMISAP